MDKAEKTKQQTALLLALEKGHEDVASELIHSKADLEKGNASEESPLIVALKTGHLEIVKMLLQAKVDLDKAEKTKQQTALLFALEKGYEDVASELIHARGRNWNFQISAS